MTAPQLSPGGQWWWTGDAWVAAADHPEGAAALAALEATGEPPQAAPAPVPAPVAVAPTPAVVAPAPAVVAPTPVVVAPAPVVAPVPVVQAPPPVVVAPAPVVPAPAPVVPAPVPVVSAPTPAPVVQAPAPVVPAPAPVVPTQAPAPVVQAAAPVVPAQMPVAAAPEPAAPLVPEAPVPEPQRPPGWMPPAAEFSPSASTAPSGSTLASLAKPVAIGAGVLGAIVFAYAVVMPAIDGAGKKAADTVQKPIVAADRAVLQIDANSVAQAEAASFSETGSYTGLAGLAQRGFRSSPGVQTQLVRADGTGYCLKLSLGPSVVGWVSSPTNLLSSAPCR